MDIHYIERSDTIQKEYLKWNKDSDLNSKIVTVKQFIQDMLESNMLKKIVMESYHQHQIG